MRFAVPQSAVKYLLFLRSPLCSRHFAFFPQHSTLNASLKAQHSALSTQYCLLRALLFKELQEQFRRCLRLFHLYSVSCSADDLRTLCI